MNVSLTIAQVLSSLIQAFLAAACFVIAQSLGASFAVALFVFGFVLVLLSVSIKIG